MNRKMNMLAAMRHHKCTTIALLVFLIFNIIVPSVVITIVVIRQGKGVDLTLRSEELKAALDKDYQDEQSKQTNDVKVEEPTKQASREFLSLLKPVVHLPGFDVDKSVKANNNSCIIRNWVAVKGSERFCLYNGPTYEDGSITIPTPGLYITYSHVKFYLTNRKETGDPMVFKHEIVKSNVESGNTEVLLYNRFTECRENVPEGSQMDYPSDLHGVFELRKGDQLRVNVSHPHYLTDSRDWNYFGLYIV